MYVARWHGSTLDNTWVFFLLFLLPGLPGKSRLYTNGRPLDVSTDSDDPLTWPLAQDISPLTAKTNLTVYGMEMIDLSFTSIPFLQRRSTWRCFSSRSSIAFCPERVYRYCIKWIKYTLHTVQSALLRSVLSDICLKTVHMQPPFG